MDKLAPSTVSPPALAVSVGKERMNVALGKLRALLIDGEVLEVVCAQLAFPAFIRFKRRTLVAATRNRLLVIRRPFFGGFVLQDFQWQDLENAQIRESVFPGLFGAVFNIKTQTGGLEVKGLPPLPAMSLYRSCQAQEQAWREKNRIRVMEEARAKAGGVVIGAHPGAATGLPSAASSDDVLTRLGKAKALHAQGVLSDAEFEAMKAKLLSEV